MKNIFLALSLFTAVLVSGFNKVENVETSSEVTNTESTTQAEHPAHVAAVYACPMHPEVTSDKPGNCPKCGMDLEKVDAAAKPEEPAQ